MIRILPSTGARVTIRVVVADDDVEVAAALCAVFEADDRFEVAAAVHTGGDAIEVLRDGRPATLLLDVGMPGGGVVAAAHINDLGLPVTVVALTAQADAALVAAMVRVGARGVLLKGRAGRALPDLVERCSNGQVILATPAAAEGIRLLLGETHGPEHRG
jgi:DNA-binding NarL/FixJ family response regulator